MTLDNRIALFLLVLGFSIAISNPSQAQGDLVPEKRLKEVKKSEGWDFILTTGFNTSLSDNRSMIGQPDGLTMTIGATIIAGADYRFIVHELRNMFNLTETFTHTPTLEEFVKSTDILKYESIYLYHLLDWLGPFFKLNLDTVLLEGFDTRPEPVAWRITRNDGSQENRAGFHLRLSDGLQPLTLKETAGFFAKPYESKKLNFETRLGFGGMQVFADGQLAIQDDDTTPLVDVIELKSFSQAGGVLDLAAWGQLYEKRVIYKVSAGFMMPFISDLEEGDDRSITELTNIEINASISFKLLEWLALDYVFRAIRQPQLLDEFQIQNNLLLTASYSFFKPKKEEKK